MNNKLILIRGSLMKHLMNYTYILDMKLLTTNKYMFFVCQQCAHEKAVKMKLEEERDQETLFIMLRLIIIQL